MYATPLRNSLVSYQLKAKLDGQSLVFCNYCRKYFYTNYFFPHLQFCVGLHLNNNGMLKKKLLTYEKINVIKTSPNQIFTNLVKEKKVILVGPSITVQECELGKFIDSFDIVVRLNKSLPIPPKLKTHIGSRTDILYNSLNMSDYPGENNIHPIFLKRNQIKYLRCPYPPITPFRHDIESFQKKNKGIIHFGFIPLDYYKKLRNGLGTRPYTGICAIADLLNCGVKELYVMGMDFYTYGYAQYYRKISSEKLKKLRNNNIHKRFPQINLVKRFYLLDNRLIVDNILENILLEKYDFFLENLKNKIDISRILVNFFGNFFSDDLLNKCLKKRKTKKNICILGEKEVHSSEYCHFDFIIDFNPSRKQNVPSNIQIYKSTETQLSKKTMIFTKTLDTEVKKNKSKNMFFINPLFAKYLKELLEKTVVPEGMISSEMFILLFFILYCGNYSVLSVSNMSPFHNWNHQPNKNYAISQRMLYQYFIRKNLIQVY
jgi:hypothetical protein